MRDSGYTKVFASMLDSSVWDEDDQVVRVWLTLLLLCDQDGMVTMMAPGISRRSRVPLEATERALQRLSEPDPMSRCVDHEGRRIELRAQGWRILNFLSYRERMTNAHRQELARERQRNYRDRKALAGPVMPKRCLNGTNVTRDESNANQNQKKVVGHLSHQECPTADDDVCPIGGQRAE